MRIRRLGRTVGGDDQAPAGGGLELLWLSDHPRRRGGECQPGAPGHRHASEPFTRWSWPAAGARVRRLPRILDPDEIDALMGALRTERDRAMTQAMVLGGLRRCEVLGLRLGDLRLGEWRVLITEGKGGHERLVPLSPTFFATVARYMDHERPVETRATRSSLSSKDRAGPAALSARPRPDHPGRPTAGRSQPRHLPRAAPHLLHPIARSGHGHRSHPGPGRTPLDHLDPGLSPPQRRLAGRRVPAGLRSHRGPGTGGVAR